jgi:uncharacterized protein YegP (UPF0339 family)
MGQLKIRRQTPWEQSSKSSKDKSKVTGKAVECRWRLIHTNGQVIANSGEGYTTKANVISGINSVKENAPNATVEDKTA